MWFTIHNVLAGTQIRKLISGGLIKFDGTVRGNALLLTLGNCLLEFARRRTIDPWDENSVRKAYKPQRNNWKSYDLEPGRSVLISAMEYLALPYDLGGIIGTLSHVARLGLFAHFSSPHVGPTYRGHLALELLNCSPHILRLQPSMPVAKVILLKTTGRDPARGLSAIPFYYNSQPASLVDLRSRFWEEFKRIDK